MSQRTVRVNEIQTFEYFLKIFNFKRLITYLVKYFKSMYRPVQDIIILNSRGPNLIINMILFYNNFLTYFSEFVEQNFK